MRPGSWSNSTGSRCRSTPETVSFFVSVQAKIVELKRQRKKLPKKKNKDDKKELWQKTLQTPDLLGLYCSMIHHLGRRFRAAGSLYLLKFFFQDEGGSNRSERTNPALNKQDSLFSGLASVGGIRLVSHHLSTNTSGTIGREPSVGNHRRFSSAADESGLDLACVGHESIFPNTSILIVLI